jgi:hypothetical protein
MAGVDFEKRPFRERPDLTPYLVHLTKRTRTPPLSKIPRGYRYNCRRRLE